MNIFISYRRHDTAGEAGRLVDSLKQYFKEEEIFIDIDTIKPGLDFTDVIEESLKSCDILLALIGPNWLNLKDTNGKRRIDADNDFIRLEIAEALKRKIQVIPVLVDGANLPATEDLPDDIKGLVRRQAYEISNKRWKYDVEELVKCLKPADPKPGPKPNPGPIPRPTPIPPVQPTNIRPKNWLVESIVATIICCVPFGIAGIVNANKVDSRYNAGDFEGALKASKEAGKWTKIAFIVGIVVYALYFIYALTLTPSGDTFSDY